MSESGTLAYRYAVPSSLSRDGVLSVATSGGVTDLGSAAHPYFFTGFLADPGPEALRAAPVACGTTNVDFNPPMRGALASAVATAGQILLKVGDEQVTAVTESAAITERKVKLPARWVKGFGEVSAVHARMRLVADIAGPEAQRFLASLPRVARSPDLSASSGLSPERTGVALATLASSGRVGYDLADGAYFHRELPLGAEVAKVHPRLADARSLIETGQVTLTEGGAISGGHRVTFGPGAGGAPGDTCTCPWWGKHQGTRGPCKHVLAARIVAGQAR